MATTKIIKIDTVLSLDPGKSTHRKWNNASPEEAVWSANAMPIVKTLEAQQMELEVTRLWRKLIVTGSGGSVTTESEIHYVVKNVGTTKAHFIVFLCVIS